jgi:hypothetical protein
MNEMRNDLQKAFHEQALPRFRDLAKRFQLRVLEETPREVVFGSVGALLKVELTSGHSVFLVAALRRRQAPAADEESPLWVGSSVISEILTKQTRTLAEIRTTQDLERESQNAILELESSCGGFLAGDWSRWDLVTGALEKRIEEAIRRRRRDSRGRRERFLHDTAVKAIQGGDHEVFERIGAARELRGKTEATSNESKGTDKPNDKH